MNEGLSDKCSHLLTAGIHKVATVAENTWHTDLAVDLAGGQSCVAEFIRVAVGGVEAAAGRNAVGGVIHTAKPTGVVIHTTATQL